MLKRFFILMFIAICSISILGCENEEEKQIKQDTNGSRIDNGGRINIDKIAKENPIKSSI